MLQKYFANTFPSDSHAGFMHLSPAGCKALHFMHITSFTEYLSNASSSSPACDDGVVLFIQPYLMVSPPLSIIITLFFPHKPLTDEMQGRLNPTLLDLAVAAARERIREVSPEEAEAALGRAVFIDVRESDEYRAKRDELLDLEVALRAQVEAVAEARRALPPGGRLGEPSLAGSLGA